jgi:hypothetical protein
MSELSVVEETNLWHHTPAEISEIVNKQREMLRSVLEVGTDYMVIPGTPKPSLLQSGAEKMLMLAGGSIKMDRIEETPEGVTYKCTATLGDRSSESEGYAGRDEHNLRSANRNTLLKMAQKRAKVGAVSSLLALSGILTQDMEDTRQVNTVDLVNPYLEQLDEEGKAELKKWRKEEQLPPPSDMSLEQVAAVLVRVGVIVGRAEGAQEQAEYDADNERVAQEKPFL